MPDHNPIRLALIGAGIFARDVHVPALQALDDTFEIVAIYSRSQANAAALAARLPGQVEATADLPELLAREDIEAVNIILPIEVMPGVVELALGSGKHVISEKPLAPDVATGRRLLELHAQHSGQIWLVGENWRYEDAFEQAAAIVHSGELGRPLLCHWVVYNPINPDNKYYHTPWRRSGGYPGGFLLDVGVHHVAVLRWLLGEISQVSAMTGQIRADLPPADILSATLQFESGVSGVYLATYAVNAPWPPELTITGEHGSLRVHRQGLEVTSNGLTRSVPVTPHQGVKKELAAFAAAIRRGEPHRNSPQQCLQDVAVVEAMLRSAETGRHVAPERIILFGHNLRE
jgi:predicted dehydrogenase